MKKRAPRPSQDPVRIDYQALAEFRFALRRFLAFSAEAVKKAGLTPQQHQALLALKGGSDTESMTVQELAAQLLVQHNSTVELVDRLEVSGLVRRARDLEDGRRARVLLTSKAQRLLRSLSSAHIQELKAARPAFLALLRKLD